MTVRPEIQALIDKIPRRAERSEAVRRWSKPLVNISGLLIASFESSLVIAVGDSEITVPISEIANIKESDSRPADGEQWSFVTVSVAASCEIVESRRRLASDLGEQPGRRPFVYETASLASDHSISSEEFVKRKKQWFTRVGLEFRPFDATTYLTASNTSKSTSYETAVGTTTPDDTSTDYNEDNKSDDQQDFTEDLKDDPSNIAWRG